MAKSIAGCWCLPDCEYPTYMIEASQVQLVINNTAYQTTLQLSNFPALFL